MCAATGRSCVTAALIATRRSPVVFSMRSEIRRQPTPASLGFRMPAEWEPHEATWLAWPHNHSDWPGRFAPIPWVYAEIIRNLARGEAVHILVQDATEEKRA